MGEDREDRDNNRGAIDATLAAARELRGGDLSAEDAAYRVRTLWDFDNVIYRGLEPFLDEFVLMSWLQGSDAYEQSGGEVRLRSAADGLVKKAGQE